MDHSDTVDRNANPRENANFFSLLTFLYTRKLFSQGYKKDLEDYDLYKVIRNCRSKECADKLEHAYAAQKQKKKKSVLKILWGCYGPTYMILGLSSLAWKMISSAMEPEAISQLVAYFKPGQTKMTANDALYFAGVLIALKLLHTLYYPNYQVFLVQLAYQMRTAFSSLIYRKTLKLSPKALEKTSLGNIVTLITKDVIYFESAIWLFNDIWIGIIQIIYICYLIYSRIGLTSAVGVLILASAIPMQYYVSIVIKNLRIKLNKKTDIRLQETQEALSTIRIIKMYTWENIFANRIGETRRKEIKILLLKSLTRLGLMVSSDILAKIGFYALVMLYIYLNTDVDAETIFYIMKCHGTLRHSVSLVFSFGFTLIAEFLASLQRIEVVLKLEELPEHFDKPDDDPQVDVRDVTVNMRDQDILKNITLKLDAGLNIVTGQLGSGKSSLLKMMLREYPTGNGELRTRGRKSYASQDPWLFPATIKQNILFGEKYDYKRYNEVVEICALTYDFGILEKGDDTIVADKGMNLSKGQQARVNLARAIYRDSDIYLIDDALTALDTKVQDHIFKECIESFLKNKLVILVTHNPQHIAKANKIVILENGSIKLIRSPTDISKEIAEALEDLHKKEEEPTENYEIEDTIESVTENTKLIKEIAVKKQIYHEVKKEGGVDYQVYMRYIQFGGGVLFLLLILGIFVIASFTESSSQVMLTRWVNHRSSMSALKEKAFGNNSVDIEQLREAYFPANREWNSSFEPSLIPTFNWQNGTLLNVNNSDSLLNLSEMTKSQNATYNILLNLDKFEMQASKCLNLYSILLIASVVFEFAKQYVMFKLGTNASEGLHAAMINSVIYSKMSFFDTFFIGNILNRFSQDLTVVDETLPMILNLLIGASFAFAGIVGMMATVSWKFAVPAVAILIALIILRHIYMPTARSLKRLEAATRSPIIGHLNSSLEGLTTVRAYRAQEILKNEFDKHQDVFTSAKFISLCARCAFSFYIELTSLLFIVIIISRFLFFDLDTAAGDVGLALTQAGALTIVIQWGLQQWSEAENLMTSVERALEFTKIVPESRSGSETPNWPSNGEIIYQKVALKYTNSDEYVLRDITFTVKPKEKIGIVGRTGAGKSSIIATLFRLYNHEGTILIDGVNTSSLSLKHLREHISIIPQDPILFSGTIRDNMDPLNKFTDEEIWKVLHKVHLDIRVASLNTLVEETNFSSGERQLLSLGRAILRKNKIVVLDEATANMDRETEQMVQKAIDNNFSTCTAFIIAHRLDSILKCDKVMVLSRGQIIEYDKPDVLLENPDSMFSVMLKYAKVNE